MLGQYCHPVTQQPRDDPRRPWSTERLSDDLQEWRAVWEGNMTLMVPTNHRGFEPHVARGGVGERR